MISSVLQPFLPKGAGSVHRIPARRPTRAGLWRRAAEHGCKSRGISVRGFAACPKALDKKWFVRFDNRGHAARPSFLPRPSQSPESEDQPPADWHTSAESAPYLNPPPAKETVRLVNGRTAKPAWRKAGCRDAYDRLVSARNAPQPDLPSPPLPAFANRFLSIVEFCYIPVKCFTVASFAERDTRCPADHRRCHEAGTKRLPPPAPSGGPSEPWQQWKPDRHMR